MRKDHDPDPNRPRSGGPRTDEGKAKSAENSQKHGVLSENIVTLRTENPALYEEIRASYFDALEPVGFLETDLVEDIVWSKWRQMRAIRVETATIDERMDNEAEYWRRQCPTVDSPTRTCHAIKTLVDESNDLQHLNRYETRFHRMYHRSLRLLLELQEKRKRDGGSVPAPVPESTPAPPTEPRPTESARPRAQNINLPNELPAARTHPPLGANFFTRNYIKAPWTAPPPLTRAA